MSYARKMLEAHPQSLDIKIGPLADVLDALTECAQTCMADSYADLVEPNATEMTRCIRLCLDCVDICTASIGVLSRSTHFDASVTEPLLEACVAVCKSCGDE
jgi:hypothetical protein